jgi:hypothetical protein
VGKKKWAKKVSIKNIPIFFPIFTGFEKNHTFYGLPIFNLNEKSVDVSVVRPLTN